MGISTFPRRVGELWLAATLMLGGILLSGISRAESLLDITPMTHSGMSVARNGDGSLKFGPGYGFESLNWSGYALNSFATGQTYTSASANWVVPQAVYKAAAPTCHPIAGWGFSTSVSCFAPTVPAEYSASWVGIGGNCEDANCVNVDTSLIQLGTSQNAGSDGSTLYYAWYEILPANETIIGTTAPCGNTTCVTPNPVFPGDAITASLQCVQNCTPGAQQQWNLTLKNHTQNWTFNITLTYASTLASVEWIQEAPASSAGILPLADFSTTTFAPFVNGQAVEFQNSGFGSIGRNAIVMVNAYGQTSMPSAASLSGMFSTCWGNNQASFAPCAMP